VWTGCGRAARNGGVSDPAEDAALGGDHRQPDALELGEVRADAVRQHQRLVPAVVRLADGRVNAHLGRHPGDDEVGDAGRLQDGLQVGAVERALAGLVDDDLAPDRRELVDDVVPVLPADQDAAVRPLVADPLGRPAPPELCRWAVREVRQVPLSRVDHQQPA